MSKPLKIWIIVATVLSLLLIWFLFAQWNTISAFIDSLRYSQEEVTEKLEENQASLQEFIDGNENITVRDLTAEEAKALNEGTMTEEEAVRILTGQEGTKPPLAEPPAGQDKPANPSTEPGAPAEPDYNQVIAESIAKLYIQKNHYLGKIDGIESQLRSEYANVSAQGKNAAKQGILAKYMPIVADWEKTCDSVVYGILDEVKAAAEAGGLDTSIVKKLEEAYKNEKKLKKSYFINRYLG